MKPFFEVTPLAEAIASRKGFPTLATEMLDLYQCTGRICASTHIAQHPLPEFNRSVMDGYAVKASDTFGAGEANPAYLQLVGDIAMGCEPGFELRPGQTAKIATGGMLPPGADAVVMVEHTEPLGKTEVEIQRSVAPGQHVATIGEDIQKGQAVVQSGIRLRPQDIGVLAAMGKPRIEVFKQARVGIVSTGDEIIPITRQPAPGQVRDVNSYTLSGLVQDLDAKANIYPLVPDNFEALRSACRTALKENDMVLVSGGSSVGTRDYSMKVLETLPDSKILVHGIAIRPGKPTILAQAGGKPVWGLPGHVVSAMVVFKMVVARFIHHIQGRRDHHVEQWSIPARLAQNVASALGRTDFIRVCLKPSDKDKDLLAYPVLGKSGLIRTMLNAQGLIEIDENSEGLEAGSLVFVKTV